MRKTITIVALLVLGAIAATGCLANEDSCDLKTQGLSLELAAIEEGDTAQGQAIFKTDQGSAVVLGECGDSITVNGTELQAVDGTVVPVVYSAEIEPADEYTFVFSRPDAGGYTSTVSGLRPAVTVTAPAEGVDAPRDVLLDVTWDDNNAGAGNDEIELLVTGDCINFDYDATWTDSGSDTIPANSLDVDGDTTTCEAALVLTRKVSGTLDSGLNQVGSIEGWSMGRTTFTTIPTTP
ncbi:MAG: hypothetical protein M0R80_20330 [Proteobacteria bacterium]|jgi:hypothetical protein|nr:hypothetical protein [Pseudomonadota bacterium]